MGNCEDCKHYEENTWNKECVTCTKDHINFKPKMQRIKIPLGNNLNLVAEQNGGDWDREIFIFLETDKEEFVQDLAMVGQDYYIKGQTPIWVKDRFDIRLWKDSESDDVTDVETICLRPDFEEEFEDEV